MRDTAEYDVIMRRLAPPCDRQVSMKLFPGLMAVLLTLVLGGCARHREPARMADHDTSPDRSIGMPNPASAHCIRIGGRLDLRNTAGGTVGICHLPDGTEMEEWALFRRDMATR
ncbi:putative hemolysin [Gluconacetobacter entanii]|uniref:putative hemolysin n=2 Tax=Gluconacetobacter entanii TaxID=108528 RepID=UPI0021BBF27F|nr:DUF333 domain-containing protein [Gluconacetobacter entanii]MCW4584730.1 DUF333 domain-containing protein [Gluconacetobacter entanii]MCW4588144.1 DUF333 domain-containing protein [Gluconacetobacter entanii]